jgi:hypothetical protein
MHFICTPICTKKFILVKSGCYICAQSQHFKVEQVLVESCNEAIRKENDHLKIEVKRLELEVNKLKKQVKVHP